MGCEHGDGDVDCSGRPGAGTTGDPRVPGPVAVAEVLGRVGS